MTVSVRLADTSIRELVALMNGGIAKVAQAERTSGAARLALLLEARESFAAIANAKMAPEKRQIVASTLAYVATLLPELDEHIARARSQTTQ